MHSMSDFQGTESSQGKRLPSLTVFSATWGLYLGVALSITTILQVIYVVNSGEAPWWVTFLQWVFLFSITFLAMRAYRNLLPDGELAYGRALKVGFLVSVFAAIINLAVFLLMTLVIKTEYVAALHEQVSNVLERSVGDSDQLDMAYDMSIRFLSPTFLAVSTFFGMILNGLIASLITAIFAKTKRE